MNQEPSDMWQLEQTVVRIIAVQLGVPADDLSLNARFREDLDADPLTMVEIVMHLEETFDVEIEDREFGMVGVHQRLQTVGDVTNYLAHKLLGAPEMIGTDQVLALLKSACPTAPTTDSELEAREERPTFSDMAVFAHHVVDSNSKGTTGEFAEFFELLELLIVRGYFSVRLLAIHGLIEDLQNITGHETQGWQVFEPWLRPATKEAWRGVEAIWAGRSSLADVLRGERGGRIGSITRLLQTSSQPEASKKR